jgi:hypothetical protein
MPLTLLIAFREYYVPLQYLIIFVYLQIVALIDLFLYIFHVSNLIFVLRSLMRSSVFSVLHV